jgi:hypothetical protein
MTEHKSPIERALDLLVYAPVGLALTATEELPDLVDKGRQRVSSQVAVAKMIGQFAATAGQQEVGKVLKQATQTLSALGVLPPDRSAAPSTVDADPDAPAPANGVVASPNGSSVNSAPTPPREDLGIPGYDALSASQVVQRLDGLAPAELESVREYETTTRGRRTILSKIAQLQSGPGADQS